MTAEARWAAPAVPTAAARPLCVDCDGTLLRTDLLHEAMVRLVRQRPLDLFAVPGWLLRGKAHLKARLAERVALDVSDMPVRPEVRAVVEQARSEGRPTWLVTASPLPWAQAVADREGGFTGVIASTPGINLAGAAKAEALIQRFGERGFDYVGDSPTDLAVWRHADRAIVVGSEGLAAQAGGLAQAVTRLQTPAPRPATYLKALRVHQWLKNLLVWVPLAAAHQLGSAPALQATLLAFLAFGLCASSVYLINDLLDLDADRAHPRKRQRALASGLLPIWQGVALVPCLLLASAALCWTLPPLFGMVLGLYFALTLAYSIRLKRQVVVDVTVLAILYTLRIIAGAAATAIQPSFWLLAFSMFVFTSLAMIKRYAELRLMLARNLVTTAGRGYRVDDLPVLAAVGASCGVAAVMVLALYINDPETASRYPNPPLLWVLPVLMLYWISRVWMKAHREELHDDPVVFAATDWQSLTIAVLILGLLVGASFT